MLVLGLSKTILPIGEIEYGTLSRTLLVRKIEVSCARRLRVRRIIAIYRDAIDKERDNKAYSLRVLI
jgi:hypothetical protein